MSRAGLLVLLLLLTASAVNAFVSDEDDSFDDVYMRDFWVTFGGVAVIVITVLVAVAFYRVWHSTDVASTNPIMIREIISSPPKRQVRPQVRFNPVISSSSSDNDSSNDLLSGR